MFGPKKDYEFTYSVRNSLNITINATNTIYIDISYKEQYYGYDMEYIVLTFINRWTTIETGNSTEMIDTQFTFTLHGKEVSNNSLIELMGLVVFILFVLFSIIMLTAGVMGYSIGIWFDLFSLLQLVHMFPVARLYLPTSLYKFFKALEFLNFQKLNIGFWDFENVMVRDELGENGRPANYNFEKMGFTTRAFFHTAQDTVMFIIYLSFFPIFVRTLALIFDKSVFLRNFEKKALWPFLPFMVYITVFILTFTSVLNFSSNNVFTGSEVATTMASFSYFIFIVLFTGYLLLCTIIYWKEVRTARKQNPDNQDAIDAVRMGSIKGYLFFTDFRTTNDMYYWYPIIYVVRRILVACILVIWMENGFDQLMMLSILSGSTLVWLNSYQPFRSRLRNICASGFEFSYL